LLGGLIGTTAATFVGGVIAAAIVGAAASIVQQGLLIAMGYQDKFSWGAVGKAALTQALTFGVNAGFNQISGLQSVANATSTWAKVARVALDVGKAASVQLIQHGKITSWTSLAAAAVGGTARNFGTVDQSGNVTGVLGKLNAIFDSNDDVGKFVTP